MKQYTVILKTNIVIYNINEKFIKDNKHEISKVFLQITDTTGTHKDLVEVHDY